MTLKALFFGSIGVLAETSDIQRRAYNQAFKDKGVAWHWDEETYRYLLQFVGGQARMHLLSNAAAAGLSDDLIKDIHAHKTALAGDMVKTEVTGPRPGVHETVEAARDAGLALGIVTSTQHCNIAAIADAAGLDLDLFDVIVSKEKVAESKPNPAPYIYALEQLGLKPHEAIAFEDTAASLRSAVDAGIQTLAVPGAYAVDQDFRLAWQVLPALASEQGLVEPLKDVIAGLKAA